MTAANVSARVCGQVAEMIRRKTRAFEAVTECEAPPELALLRRAAEELAAQAKPVVFVDRALTTTLAVEISVDGPGTVEDLARRLGRRDYDVRRAVRSDDRFLCRPGDGITRAPQARVWDLRA